MSRAKWKTFFLSNSLYQGLLEKKNTTKIQRNVRIVKDLQNKTVLLSNGLDHQNPLEIKHEMLGFSCGDFVLTRAFRNTNKRRKK